MQSAGREVLLDTSLMAIFAIGSAIVIITGGIDLSAGSMIAFTAPTTTGTSSSGLIRRLSVLLG